MTQSFDMSGALRFDLNQGTVLAANGRERLVLSAAALAELVNEASGALRAHLGQALGTELGGQLEARLGASLREASVEVLADHIGGELALMGLGSLAIEQWGHALVFVVHGSPWVSPAANQLAPADDVTASLLEGVLRRSFSRDAAVLPIDRAAGTARYLACNLDAKRKVSEWLGAGVHYAEALAKLKNEGGVQ